VKDRYLQHHLSAEQFQAFLGAELAASERAEAEGHLASCARCAAEMDGWRLLFEGLEDLPTLAPGAGFADRVMSGVSVSPPQSLAARVRARLAALGPAGGHPDHGRLQDFIDGALPARLAARVRTHLDECTACSSEAAAWRTTLQELDALGHFAPAEDFAARVMAQVRVPEPAVAVAPALDWRRALAWVGHLVPQSRQAWAAVSGVALTPVVTLGLVLWTLFTHPTLTPGALASFAWWKVSELAAVAWQAVSSAALESTGVFEVYSLFGSVAQSPAALVGAFLAFSAGTVCAAWILYRNLIVNHPVDGRVAHVSLS
jgi:anti-sigma factor RsiW